MSAPTGTLVKQISRYISQHPEKEVLTAETTAFVAAELAQYIERALDKFIKGQKEHGGNLTDRKLLLEIDHELIDLFWYTRGLREKLKNV